MKLLVVEDEKDLNHILCKRLKLEGYSVDACFDGQEALDYIGLTEYDGILLDIMMPRLDGYAFLQKLRARGDGTQVLFLTAKDSKKDIVHGLDLGADDYIVKPFAFEELLARIRVMLRRRYGRTENTLCIGDLCLDSARKQIESRGQRIELTAKEYRILEYLMENADHILSRQQIQDHVWDFDYDGASNLIDVLVKNIRQKLAAAGSHHYIVTKRGLGYVVYKDAERMDAEGR